MLPFRRYSLRVLVSPKLISLDFPFPADFDVSCECFASPLNSHFTSYCSAFPDIDQYFGSLGSFFSFYPRQGSFQANPPFDPSVIHLMAVHIDRLLGARPFPGEPGAEGRAAKAAGKAESKSTAVSTSLTTSPGPLSFVVIVPKNSGPGWTMMSESPFKTAEITLGAREVSQRGNDDVGVDASPPHR